MCMCSTAVYLQLHLEVVQYDGYVIERYRLD